MRKIRIGNDISIKIHVRHNGQPADFTERNLTLYLVNKYSKTKINDFTIEGDVLSFVFKGTEQKHTGKYYLTLQENFGVDNQNVADTYDVFELVHRSTMIDDSTHDNGIHSLDVSMNVDVNPIGGGNDVVEYDITEIYNYCLDNNSVYFPEELFNKVFGSSEQFLEDEKSTVYLKLQIDNALYFRGPCGSMNIHQEGFSLSFKGFNNYFAQELIMINIGFEMSKSNIVYELITTLGSTSMERIKQSINGNK